MPGIDWLSETISRKKVIMNYLSTIIAVLILAVILIMAVRHIVRTKKQGGCVGCPHSSSCGSGSCCCGSCNTEEK